MATWIKEKSKNKRFNPKAILETIESKKSVDSDGKVTFRGGAVEGYTVALATMVTLDTDVPPNYTPMLVRKALRSAGANGKLEKDSFLGDLTKHERRYLEKPFKRYVVLTSISLSCFKELSRITEGTISVSFHKVFPKKFLKHREKLFDDQRGKYPEFISEAQEYTKAVIRVNARDEGAAFQIGLDQFDYLRGMLNFLANKRSMKYLYGRKGRPINKIRLGPAHTVHEENGAAAIRNFWYEPEYRKWKMHRLERRDMPLVISECRKNVRNIRAKAYSEMLKNAFRRYAKAFDHSDLNVSLLRAWSLLELLTDTGFSSYDITVNRASFLLENHGIHKQILHHLREVRNQSVHSASEYDDEFSQDYVIQIKQYIDVLLGFYLSLPTAKSFDDIIQLLSLPPDVNSFDQAVDDNLKKGRLLSWAKKFVG